MLPTGEPLQEARGDWINSDQSLGVFRDRYLDEMISEHVEPSNQIAHVPSLGSRVGTVPEEPEMVADYINPIHLSSAAGPGKAVARNCFITSKARLVMTLILCR